MKTELKVTLGQINPTIGDLEGNIALMLAVARKAHAAGADMVVFPELSLTGYSPADLLDDPCFLERLEVQRKALYAASRATPGLYWVVGLPLRRADVAGGRLFYNALQVLHNGAVVHTQYKQLLPTYGVFDERRHFEPGPDVAKVLRIHGATIGFLICEDGWNDEGRDYPVNPFQRLADAAPDLVISINASPSHKGKRKQRHEVFSAACTRHMLPLLYVAQVGGQDQLVFDGASFAVDATGRLVFEAARFEVDSPTLRFHLASQTFLAEDGAALPPVPLEGLEGLSVMEFYRQQIVLGLRDYARRCGFTKVVVGSSGGIDSALTLALAVDALGSDNVHAITMPSVFSSQGSVSDSEALCANLGIKLDEVPIRGIVDRFSSEMATSTIGEAPGGLALENLQARIRGTLLMTFSNQYGHLVLTTGNKSELSVGYCTLYGDTNGGLGLIGDLYKTEVFELARHINCVAGRELIPQAIIDKAPSAELAPDQKDTDSLPPYEVLDELLKVLIEGSLLDPAEHDRALETYLDLRESEAGQEVISKVQRLIARSEYKRRQAPPIIRLRARAFGTGRQLPLTARQY
ncbi:NAD+ synthetase [Burkholderia ubonensis]|uniref:Glutamine-dependent NAD(+) synthetase n=1 Tax=Burkholderia ubonensis TaxID=101571 RepID=A0A106QBD6_9BURK|nr:NAD+ synthase [Burkholderia ubonensis]KWA83751.1 NAD+ synthetase [Burkholderia ubonensis]